MQRSKCGEMEKKDWDIDKHKNKMRQQKIRKLQVKVVAANGLCHSIRNENVCNVWNGLEKESPTSVG